MIIRFALLTQTPCLRSAAAPAASPPPPPPPAKPLHEHASMLSLRRSKSAVQAVHRSFRCAFPLPRLRHREIASLLHFRPAKRHQKKNRFACLRAQKPQLEQPPLAPRPLCGERRCSRRRAVVVAAAAGSRGGKLLRPLRQQTRHQGGGHPPLCDAPRCSLRLRDIPLQQRISELLPSLSYVLHLSSSNSRRTINPSVSFKPKCSFIY